MMVTTDMVRRINETAVEDFARAQGMLDMLNELCGTEYGWLNRRMVCSDAPRSHTADFYANCHDLEVSLRWQAGDIGNYHKQMEA